MTKINEIWTDLENDISSSEGLLLRRYSARPVQDLYIALQRPEGLRCIAIKFSSSISFNLTHYRNLKDIKVTTVIDDRDNKRCFLLFVLLNREHHDLFSILAEDLISEIDIADEEQKLLRTVLNRLEKWKALFERAGAEGLTPEEQRGLYGELYFLRKWIRMSPDAGKCVTSWHGSERELRDFQRGGCGIEVKTTHGHNHQRIHISSERQLDTKNLTDLFLYHLSLETQRGNGETLADIINSLFNLLTNDFHTLSQFRTKLLQGGYFAHHSAKYESVGYQVRQEMFYIVRDEFPRIEESDVRAGVGDIKYSIILSDQSNYKISENFVFDKIN